MTAENPAGPSGQESQQEIKAKTAITSAEIKNAGKINESILKGADAVNFAPNMAIASTEAAIKEIVARFVNSLGNAPQYQSYKDTIINEQNAAIERIKTQYPQIRAYTITWMENSALLTNTDAEIKPFEANPGNLQLEDISTYSSMAQQLRDNAISINTMPAPGMASDKSRLLFDLSEMAFRIDHILEANKQFHLDQYRNNASANTAHMSLLAMINSNPSQIATQKQMSDLNDYIGKLNVNLSEMEIYFPEEEELRASISNQIDQMNSDYNAAMEMYDKVDSDLPERRIALEKAYRNYTAAMTANEAQKTNASFEWLEGAKKEYEAAQTNYGSKMAMIDDAAGQLRDRSLEELEGEKQYSDENFVAALSEAETKELKDLRANAVTPETWQAYSDRVAQLAVEKGFTKPPRVAFREAKPETPPTSNV